MDTHNHQPLGARSPAHVFEHAQFRGHAQLLRLDFMFGDSSEFFGAKSSKKWIVEPRNIALGIKNIVLLYKQNRYVAYKWTPVAILK